MHDGALLSWAWRNICLPMGSGELIPWFALLVKVAFALTIGLSLSQSMSFHFYHADFLAHPAGRD